MYKGFFYTLLLLAVIGLHCAYVWRRRRKADEAKRVRSADVFLWVLGVLCALCVLAGLVGVLTRQDPSMPQALGGAALLLAIWFDFRLGRH